jgi:hypothetical protein
MAGKKGSLHSGWENRSHIKECVEAYNTYLGNCKRASKFLGMPHQHLRWIWIRSGLKPKGSRSRDIGQNIINECENSSINSVAKKYNIPVSTLNKRFKKLKALPQ